MLPASQLACDSPQTTNPPRRRATGGLSSARTTLTLIAALLDSCTVSPPLFGTEHLASRRRRGSFCLRVPVPAEQSRPSVNILRREGAGSGEKHVIFQSTAQIDLCCVFFFFYPQRGFQSLLLALFVEVLVSSTLPFTPPLPRPSLPDAHTPLLHSHNSAVTWQRGPSWTQHQPRCHGN